MMIVTVEPKEYVPCGQLAISKHPGILSLYINKNDVGFKGVRSLLSTFSQVTLNDAPKEETYWKLRVKDNLTEELFFSGHTLIWSRASVVLKAYTIEAPIKQAVWSKFVVNEQDPNCFHLKKKKQEDCLAVVGVSIISDETLFTYGDQGEDYVTSLPFKTRNFWSFRFGLLFERKECDFEVFKNLKSDSVENHNLTTIFSLQHPLREFYPIISRTQGSVRYMNKPRDRIVYCDDDIIMTCDTQQGGHTVWRAKEISEEDSTALDVLHQITQTHGGISLPHLHMSSNLLSNSVHQSSVLSSTSKAASNSAGGHFTTSSTHKTPRQSTLSHASPYQRSFTPANSQRQKLASSIASTPARSYVNTLTPRAMSRNSVREISKISMSEALAEPLRPEICFHHVWSENSISVKTQLDVGQATKVFRVKDLYNQDFLCYFIATLSQLRVVRYSLASCSFQLIFGVITCIPAKDAQPLHNLKMFAVLDYSGFIILYSGKTKIQKVNLTGLPSFSADTFPLGTPSARINTPQPISTPAHSTRIRTITNLADENFLSPVQELCQSELENISVNTSDEFGYITHHSLAAGSTYKPASLPDVAGSHLILELSNRSLHRVEIPDLCSTNLVATCFDALRFVLPNASFMRIITKWYTLRHAPGALDGNKLEWNLFVTCLHDFIYNTNVTMASSLSYKASMLDSVQFDSLSSPVCTKKARSDILDDYRDNSDEDWLLMKKTLSQEKQFYEDVDPDFMEDETSGFFFQSFDNSLRRRVSFESSSGDTSNLTCNMVLSAFCALHAVFEEQKLSVLNQSNASFMAPFLFKFANDLGLFWFQQTYIVANPSLTRKFVLKSKSGDGNDEDHNSNQESLIPIQMKPCVFENLLQLMKDGALDSPFIFLSQITTNIEHIFKIYQCLFSTSDEPVLKPVVSKFISSDKSREMNLVVTPQMTADDLMKEKCKCVLNYMVHNHISSDTMLSWPVGVLLPVQDYLLKYASEPSLMSPSDAFTLLGRDDLVAQTLNKASDWQLAGLSPSTDPMRYQWVDSESGDYDNVHEDFDVCKLVKFLQSQARNIAQSSSDSSSSQTDPKDVEPADDNITRLLFPKDHRMEDVQRMLDCSNSVHLHLTQDSRMDDQEFNEHKQQKALQLANRTMALAIGRGMVNFRTEVPCVVRGIQVMDMKLSACYIDPSANSTSSANDQRANVEVEVSDDLTEWAQFHNGVAAALAVRSDDEEASWIHLTRPNTTNLSPYDLDKRDRLKQSAEVANNEHAGTMLGLGLNLHLHDFQALNVHSYLKLTHDLTTIGTLLGVAADKCGTCDSEVLKMLTVHLPVMLPTQVSQMEIPYKVQTAALIGVGLLYLGSSKHLVAEMLLKEIDCSPMGENETAPDREAYSLSAGFALGLVAIGSGDDNLYFGDLNISNKLYHYMTGSHRIKYESRSSQEQSYQQDYELSKASEKDGHLLEGDRYNTEVTAPAAMIALALIFLKSGNLAVAEWFNSPETLLLLEKIKPQHLLLQTLVHSLIMWDDVKPTRGWILDHIPSVLKQRLPTEDHIRPFLSSCLDYYRNASETSLSLDYDDMTVVHSYLAIISGACLSIGFRFAGSQHREAFQTVLFYVDLLIELTSSDDNNSSPVSDVIGRRFHETCFSACLIALSMIVAGSGNLQALQRCRSIHYNINNSEVSYGGQMAAHMALGFIFLGKCKYTLKTTNKAIAALLMSVFPCFPGRADDNRYHLQALRHMYVMATERRLLVPIDVETKRPCYARLTLHYMPSLLNPSGTRVSLFAPCILPEFRMLQSITVDDSRHWRISLNVQQQMKKLQSLVDDGLYVQRYSNCLSYIRDSKGYAKFNDENFTTQKQPYQSRKQNVDVLQLLTTLCSHEKKDDVFLKIVQLLRSQKVPSKLTFIFMELFQICENLNNQIASPLEVLQLILAQSYMNKYVESPNIISLNEMISVKITAFFDHFESENLNLIQSTLFDTRSGGDYFIKSKNEIMDSLSTARLCTLASYIVYSRIYLKKKVKKDEDIDANINDVFVPPELIAQLEKLQKIRF